MQANKQKYNLIISKNLQYLMDSNNISRKQICHDLDFKYTTFCDWINGRIIPKSENLEKLSNYFGLKISDLFIELEKLDSKKSAKRLSSYNDNIETYYNKELTMEDLIDRTDDEIKALIAQGYRFKHKTYEERLAECNGKFHIAIYF